MKKLPNIRSTGIVVQTIGKEVLIYDLKTHRAFNLNETASAIYQACDGKTSFEELRAKSNLTDDIIYLALDDFRRRNLVEKTADYHSPFGGITRREAIRRVGLATMIALPLISSLVAPTAAQAQSILAAVCTTPGGDTCNTTADCVANTAYCGTTLTPSCTCISNCCVECVIGLNACSNICVDLSSDPSNCGTCGKVCPAPGICIGGNCVVPL